jgi:hypothetical protein
MGLFSRDLFEAIASTASCAAFSVVATVAHGQSANLTQFSDPYAGVVAYTNRSASGAPKPVKRTASQISRSETAAKKQPASALGTATWTLADPSFAAAPTAPVAPSVTNNAPVKDSALGFGFKLYGSNSATYNAGSSTIPGMDQLKRDSNDLLGDPSSSGSGVEAGVNLKF